IFAEGMAWQIIWIGVFVGLLSLAAGYWDWLSGRRGGQTIIFTTFALFQTVEALGNRSLRDLMFRIGFFTNSPLFFGVALNVVLQSVLIYVPFFQRVFSTTALSVSDLALTLVFSSVVFWAIELQKYFVRCRRSSKV